MKKLLMVPLFALVTIVSLGQDRVNAKPILITFNKQISQSTGWNLDNSGVWKNRVNRIPSADVDKVLLDYEEWGLGEDNFISYQIGDIKIEDSTYIIVVKKYKDGYYKYETIKEGWRPCLSVDYFIINKTEYSKIKDIKPNTKNFVSIKPICYGVIKYVITNENLLYQVKKDISEKKAGNFLFDGETSLFVGIYPISKNSKVRFYISPISPYQNMESMVLSFDNSYYETSLGLFNNFIPIINNDKGYVVNK